ncbi:hypothetical protein L6452_21954 [Arctium lappa]|uniref:Uncharacterized protein n=1 Tax=Arctium lappa TaxID=4217 RepID=A0ACB9AZ53_ARCLA|nr:hypothetical protein L6452_21954 [Arctium lappa]
MLHKDEDDGDADSIVNRTDDEQVVENRGITMNVVVDSRIPMEGVESLMKDFTMNDSASIDKDTTGSKTTKYHKEKVGSIRRKETVSSTSTIKNPLTDCFQVGSSSRVTRSQRRRQIEVERARKESGYHPPHMGAKNTTSTHGTRPVTVSSIHEVLGLPTGGIDILVEPDVDMDNNELLNTIVEKMASIKRLKKEAEDDIHNGLTNFENKDRFISLRCKMDSLFHSSTASSERTPNPTKKT